MAQLMFHVIAKRLVHPSNNVLIIWYLFEMIYLYNLFRPPAKQECDLIFYTVCGYYDSGG